MLTYLTLQFFISPVIIMRKVQTAASLRVLQCFLLHGSIQQWYGVGKDEEDEAKEKLCLAFLLSPETVNQHSAAAYTQVNGNSRLPHVKYRGCAAGSESAASACALAAITQTTAGQFFFLFFFLFYPDFKGYTHLVFTSLCII